ncbi:MAG TPA: ATP-binding cassette domain-containing protein [Verrucomicrobiales bacterium]|nr:ATP-binding cassette domain-containing protein [Verrucomicrobiales bacterium]
MIHKSGQLSPLGGRFPGSLSVKSLTKVYDGAPVVSEVSFSLPQLRVVALAGGNGSGKSTLLKMIAGVTSPDAGSVVWNEESLPAGDCKSARSRGIELIHQDGGLCHERSILENLFLGREHVSRIGLLRMSHMRSLADELIARYELPLPGVGAKVRHLSGGQRKAVAIGRALLSKPRLLLLDEPTAALGVKEQQMVLRTLRELAAEGVGIVLCTHSPDEIVEVAEHLLVLSRGELIGNLTLPGPTKAELALMMST